jgi:hypothetical protein
MFLGTSHDKHAVGPFLERTKHENSGESCRAGKLDQFDVLTVDVVGDRRRAPVRGDAMLTGKKVKFHVLIPSKIMTFLCSGTFASSIVAMAEIFLIKV